MASAFNEMLGVMGLNPLGHLVAVVVTQVLHEVIALAIDSSNVGSMLDEPTIQVSVLQLSDLEKRGRPKRVSRVKVGSPCSKPLDSLKVILHREEVQHSLSEIARQRDQSRRL